MMREEDRDRSKFDEIAGKIGESNGMTAALMAAIQSIPRRR